MSDGRKARLKRQVGCGREKNTDLTGGVNDVTIILDPLIVDALREMALDGGVIGLDKVVLNELNDE